MKRPLFASALAISVSLAIGSLHGQTVPPAGAQRGRPPQKPPAKPATPAKPPAAPAEPAPPVAKAPPPPSDVKIVTSYTQGAQVFQNTTYLKEGRQRVEFPGMVTLEQCDLHRTVILNPDLKRYREQKTQAPEAASAPAPAAPQAPAPAGGRGAGLLAQMGGPAQQPRGGVVVLTTTLTDTLERQTMFGVEARHIKTVVTKQPGANACDKTPMQTEIDGWYIDLPPTATSCSKSRPPEPPPAADECRDRIETKTVGDVSLGFPVKTTTTTTTGEGDKRETTSSSAEVTTLDITRLDPSLFDIPADYAAASSTAELVPAIATGASLEEVLFGSTANGTSQAAPKKPGVTRIGVLEPVNKSGRALNTRLLRQDLVGKFKAPYDALPLSGSSAADIQADAARLGCDYILLAEITEVKTSKPGKVGGLLKSASGGGAPSKDVHEVKATYRLYPAAATATPRATGEVKASSGGSFGLSSALKIASFAGQMYMGVGMLRMMRGGFGMGMDPISAMVSSGGLGPKGFGYFDPRTVAMNSAMSSMAMNLSMAGVPGMSGDASDNEVFQTVSESFENIAKATTAKLTPGAK